MKEKYIELIQRFQIVTIALGYTVGFIITQILISKLSFSAVLSSAIVGVIGGLSPFPLAGALYAGSFFGMISQDLVSPIWMGGAGIVTGSLLLYFTRDRVNGFGGKLGTIAFVSSIVTFIIHSMVTQ